jgi:nucleoid-associated protein YgaU
MKLSKVVLILSLLSLVACSSKSKSEKVIDSAQEAEISQTEDADFIVDAEDEELIAEDSEEMDEITEEVVAEVSEAPSSEEMVAAAPIIESELAEYTVKKGDTLMLIAFGIYGDYRKWKDLRDWNEMAEVGLEEGSTLKYKKPAEEFSWNPEGLPYMVKHGDTLGSISNEKYGTPKKWVAIYENNQPLIRDKNLIFAGFTLYYTQERDLASE